MSNRGVTGSTNQIIIESFLIQRRCYIFQPILTLCRSIQIKAETVILQLLPSTCNHGAGPPLSDYVLLVLKVGGAIQF